jgi:5-oxoprolinase (ATP-hydrolysing)
MNNKHDAIQIELFANRFVSIAREMGEMLRRASISTNVKERLDFSCALLDGSGELVVNAPHIPVHLGAMGLCVRALAKAFEMKKGDVVVTNHPAFGGTHLPDITVVTPVFFEGALLGYVASRAHHAEIGGVRPGSMPPDARNLAEEGTVIPPTPVVRGGRNYWNEIRKFLTSGRYPSRRVEENLADLNAQVAANHSGEQALKSLAGKFSVETVSYYMEALKHLAEERIASALESIGDGTYDAEEFLDDGSKIKVRIEISGGRADVDFTGTADVHPGNLNATPAVVRSAVLYVMRLLVAKPMPLNEGLMRRVNLNIPRGMLNPDFPLGSEDAPAIVGGNVETSQRIVDTLLKALKLAACSQGTMNNVVFGNDRVSYYETVCGGAGAGPGFNGASAVHTHMTNTRITDPEVIEYRFPVRVKRFEIRRGSGGQGKYKGGSGVIREMEFLDDLEVSVLSQHRTTSPYGMEGGEPGMPGTQRIVRASGAVEELKGIDGIKVSPRDRLILETPGGGGWGKL